MSTTHSTLLPSILRIPPGFHPPSLLPPPGLPSLRFPPGLPLPAPPLSPGFALSLFYPTALAPSQVFYLDEDLWALRHSLQDEDYPTAECESLSDNGLCYEVSLGSPDESLRSLETASSCSWAASDSSQQESELSFAVKSSTLFPHGLWRGCLTYNPAAEDRRKSAALLGLLPEHPRTDVGASVPRWSWIGRQVSERADSRDFTNLSRYMQIFLSATHGAR